jgi:error-prone DNA polymerase
MNERRGYAELFCKTNYSFLEGASHASELIKQAAKLGLHSLALTDLNGVYGLPKAFATLQELRAEQDCKLRLICGAELSLGPRNKTGATGGELGDGLAMERQRQSVSEPHRRIVLLAKTRKGYGQICRILTKAHEGREKGEACLEWLDFLFQLKALGPLDFWAIPVLYTRTGFDLPAAFDVDEFRALSELVPGHVLVPLVFFKDGHDSKRANVVSRLSELTGCPLVASNYCLYHIPERARLQDTLRAIDANTTVDEMGFQLHSNNTRHLLSVEQMQALYADFPQALKQTLLVAESCTFEMNELRYRYPSEWIPNGETAFTFMSKLVFEGAHSIYGSQIPENVLQQIQKEFDLIQQLQFSDYFLTIWDICDYAKKQQILFQGRGSAANSVVCYCLGITAIDPVRMDLLFERFISAERGEPPDIDVDFEHERREEVIQYIYEKYGRDRAAMVSCVISYRSRSSVRDTFKALGLSSGAWDRKQGRRFSDIVNERNGKDLSTDLDPQRLRLARELIEDIQDFPRHLSIHSGGFTLSADPIIEIVPVESARMEGRTIIQWDKYDLDILGLLKVDILALGMLTALRKSMNSVGGLKLTNIPADDPKTYAMIQKADTVGVFQIESRAQMNMLGRLQPKNFYDLVIEVALVRPGPIVGKMVHPYLKRRQGLEPVTIPDPRLKPILGRTLGIPLFQEQVMKMAMVLAHFTPGEADRLRRAIGAWRSSGSLERMGKLLMERLLASGLPKTFVENIFEQIKGFAEYGFPESHAASFAHLAYCSSYMKAHHPAHFTAALINSQPMGFYSNHSLLEDARRHGVEVHPLTPNTLNWDCVAHSDFSIALGWRMVVGLSRKDADRIMLQIEQKGPYVHLYDFIERTRMSPQILERLALADLFASFGLEPRTALWEIMSYRLLLESRSLRAAEVNSAAEAADCAAKPPVNCAAKPPLKMEQMSLFAQTTYTPQADSQAAFAKPSRLEQVRSDFDAFRISTHGHPMTILRELNPRLSPFQTYLVKKATLNKKVGVCGMIIVRQRPSTAKGTVFATIEDEHGHMDLIFHKTTYEKYRTLLLEHSFLLVQGRLQCEGHSYSILVETAQPLWETVPLDIQISHDWH